MNENEFNQEAKSFINSIFVSQVEQRQENEMKAHMAPIDLAAGGTHNLERFINFLVPDAHRVSYEMRLQDSVEDGDSLTLSDVKQINHVFLNVEQIVFKMVTDYYGDDQLPGVANDIVHTTMLFQSLILNIIGSRDKMANAFHDVSHAAGSKRIMNYYRTKHLTLHAEKITVNYIVQDLVQTYINCATGNGLRTDMVSMSQFTYQLGLLAENVSEVLTVLNDQINESD